MPDAQLSPQQRIVLDRPALINLLDRSFGRRLTLLVAPPGSGKTVTLTQWVAGRDDTRWVRIRERSPDGRALAVGLVSATAPLVRRPLAAAADAGSGQLGDQFIEALTVDLESIDRPVALVVDDLDQLGPDLIADIRSLVHRAPGHVHFVVASRMDPPLGQAQLRGAGQAAEVRIEQLRFGLDEVVQLVERLSSRTLDDDQTATVLALTEGWPIAVHLAALALAETDDVDACLDRFETNDRNVADFLSEEVLTGLSADLRDLLVRTSELQSFDGPLCDHVLGVTGSNERLAELERRGLLLTRLPGGRYRVHRLLREYLRHDLRRIDVAATSLRAASDYYRDVGDDVTAGDLLVDARDWIALRAHIVDAARAAWAGASFEPVRRWIAALPPHHCDRRLRLTSAAIDMAAGLSEAASFTLEALLQDNLSDGERLAALTVATGLVDGSDSLEQVIARAATIEHLVTTVDPATIPTVLGMSSSGSILAWSRLHAVRASTFLGRSDLPKFARPVLEDHAGMGALPFVTAVGERAVRDALGGDLHHAEAMARRAEFVVADQFGTHHSARLKPLVALGLVAEARGDLDVARELMTDAIGLAETWRRWSWLRLAMVEVAQIDDGAGRLPIVDLVDRLTGLPAPSPVPWLVDRALTAEALCWIRRGDPDEAARVLGRSGADRRTALPARVALAVHEGRIDEARTLLADWPSSGRFDGLTRSLLAALLFAPGEDPVGGPGLAAVVARLEREGNRRLVVDLGRRVVELVADRQEPAGLIVQSVLAGPLTTRELAVLHFLPTRMTNAEIADELYVSVNTVRTHVRHIYQKLGVGTRDGAIAAAISSGILVPSGTASGHSQITRSP